MFGDAMQAHRQSTFSFALILTMVMIGAPTLSGCAFIIPRDIEVEDEDSGAGGGSELILQLPVEAGRELLCVQGAFGSFSHQEASTRFDLDLDTSNVSVQEVYAPVSGIAYVHTESATSGFGYHVNIDVDGRRYVVIAHLNEVFIGDEVEVAQGQLIGYEGCTGYCIGDHIHVGLHEGSASLMADRGMSVEAMYVAADATYGGSPETFKSREFICGIESLGDETNGHFYESSLATVLWHPDGTLVKVPDNSRIFVIEDGRARWIEDEQVFESFKYDFSDVVLISDEQFVCHGQGPPVSRETFIEAFTDIEQNYWLVLGTEEDSERRRMRVPPVAWEQILASWGLDYDASFPPPIHPNQSIYVMNWPVANDSAKFRDGTLVREEHSSTVYVISNEAALPILDWDTHLMLGFFDRNLLWVEDGAVEAVQTYVGSCSVGVACVDKEAITACGGGLELGSGGDLGGDDSGDDDDSDPPSDDDDVGNDDDDDLTEDPPVTTCAGQDACIVDRDADGLPETLLMIEDSWIDPSLSRLPAYVYGNGGCYDSTLTSSDIVFANDDGYYEIDFTGFTAPCTVELSLISSMGADGNAPYATNMINWYWWQNHPFCATGQALCQLMDNNTSWEEWLLAVSWSPTSGLTPIGNALTSNSQL